MKETRTTAVEVRKATLQSKLVVAQLGEEKVNILVSL